MTYVIVVIVLGIAGFIFHYIEYKNNIKKKNKE